jgi:hypothetical protein
MRLDSINMYGETVKKNSSLIRTTGSGTNSQRFPAAVPGWHQLIPSRRGFTNNVFDTLIHRSVAYPQRSNVCGRNGKLDYSANCDSIQYQPNRSRQATCYIQRPADLKHTHSNIQGFLFSPEHTAILNWKYQLYTKVQCKGALDVSLSSTGYCPQHVSTVHSCIVNDRGTKLLEISRGHFKISGSRETLHSEETQLIRATIQNVFSRYVCTLGVRLSQQNKIFPKQH